MPTTTTPSILVVGSANSDLVVRTSRLPQAGESFIGLDYRRFAGGKGANQAIAAARLGATTTFVGKIGIDPEGEKLQAQLYAEGIRTDFVCRCSSAQTGLAIITIDDRGENSIVVIPGANNELHEGEIQAALGTRAYDALLLQLEIPPQTVIAACRLAEARSLPVVLDAGPAQDFPLEQLLGIDILTPNETETFALTGIKPHTTQDAQAAAEVLLRRSRANVVVLKLGDRGALLYESNGHCEYFPAFTVESIDTTAAGDAFTAAMTIEHIRTGDLRRAVMLGNAAGALATTILGAQASLPTSFALEEFCTRNGPAKR